MIKMEQHLNKAKSELLYNNISTATTTRFQVHFSEQANNQMNDKRKLVKREVINLPLLHPINKSIL